MNSKCPSCGKQSLKENEEWDKMYDRLDRNIPSHDLVVRELTRKGIERYFCSDCKYKKME